MVTSGSGTLRTIKIDSREGIRGRVSTGSKRGGGIVIITYVTLCKNYRLVPFYEVNR